MFNSEITKPFIFFRRIAISILFITKKFTVFFVFTVCQFFPSIGYGFAVSGGQANNAFLNNGFMPNKSVIIQYIAGSFPGSLKTDFVINKTGNNILLDFLALMMLK